MAAGAGPSVTGAIAAQSANGGYRAFVRHVDTVNPTEVVVQITEVGAVCVQLNRAFYYASSSNTVTTKVGSNSLTTTAVNWYQYRGGANQWVRYLGTSSSDATPRSWTFTYPRTHAAQTKTISFSVKFNTGWTINVVSSGSSASIANTTGTGSYTVAIPALDPEYSYAVELDDGTSTTTLTKWYGESLALPQPTSTGYEFAGWADEDDPSTVVYQPGAAYTANEPADLVAVWTPIITSAAITKVFAERDDGRFLWDSNTNKHTSADDNGEYVYVRAWWRVDGAATATVALGATMADDTQTVWTGTAQQVSKPGTGELYYEGVAEWGTTKTALATGRYTVDVTCSAAGFSSEMGAVVPIAFFTIDVLAGGHGIAFGKPATQQVFDVGMETNFDHDVKVLGTPLVPIGTILDFAASTAPTGYLVCDGSAVSRTTYSALFAVIGTTWGTGDGSTTFNIPDFRGRTSIGSGTGTAPDATAHTLGSGGGSETVTLSTSQMPSHSHDAAADTSYNFVVSQADAYFQSDKRVATASTSGVYHMVTQSTSRGTAENRSTQSAGGGGSHSNMTPYRTVTKIIRAI